MPLLVEMENAYADDRSIGLNANYASTRDLTDQLSNWTLPNSVLRPVAIISLESVKDNSS